jgi:hypothetical protein
MSHEAVVAQGLIGNTYASLRVISLSDEGGRRVLCRCEQCGDKREYRTQGLRTRKMAGCAACGAKGRPQTDWTSMIGKTFGSLTVTGFTYGKLFPQDKGPQRAAVCRCACGNVVKHRMYALRGGLVASCGNGCPFKVRSAPRHRGPICDCGTIGQAPCHVCRMMSRVDVMLRLGHPREAASFVAQ